MAYPQLADGFGNRVELRPDGLVLTSGHVVIEVPDPATDSAELNLSNGTGGQALLKGGVVVLQDGLGFQTICGANGDGAVIIPTAVSTDAFLVNNLPGGLEGYISYATNGRKVGEGPGAGTGVPVYFSNGAWRVFSTDAAVAA